MELMHGLGEMYGDVVFEESASRVIQGTLEVFMGEGEVGKDMGKMGKV